MIILLHVSCALLSLALASVAAWRPSRRLLRCTYGVTVAMLLSGTYLALINPGHLRQTCVSGLLYLGLVAVLVTRARRYLAQQAIESVEL